MPTSITLLFFSGRRDPTWELPAGDAAWLASRLRDVPSAAPADTLGYRGFLVQSNDPGLPSEVVVRGAAEVERFLLRSGTSHLQPEVIEAVEAAIEPR
jgi:hypothetical protein